jgi:hypothetical protein
MISKLIDVTTEFNANAKVQLDVGGWDYVVAQFVSPSGTVTFKATNDGGAVLGVSQGDAKSATNWNVIMGLNLATNTTAVNTNASSLFKFNVVGKFIQFESVGQTVGKLLINYSKIC